MAVNIPCLAFDEFAGCNTNSKKAEMMQCAGRSAVLANSLAFLGLVDTTAGLSIARDLHPQVY